MQSVILDTNILVSGIYFGGNPAIVFDEVLAGKFALILSDQIWSEYEEVLNRKKFDKENQDIKAVLEDLKTFGNWYIINAHLDISPDESDNKFLELALESKADYLITGNLKHFPESPFNSTKIVSPADFLIEIDQ